MFCPDKNLPSFAKGCSEIQTQEPCPPDLADEDKERLTALDLLTNIPQAEDLLLIKFVPTTLYLLPRKRRTRPS